MSDRSTAPLSVADVLRRSADWLGGRGSDTPRLDAEILIGHALGIDRIALYTDGDRPLTPDELAACRSLVARRGEMEPVAHIIGRRAFGRLDLEVTLDVLVPRADTEIIVDVVVEVAPDGARIADWGTGSGAIALSVADLRPDVHVIGLERSPAALAVARRNLAANPSLVDRVDLLQSDGMDAVAGEVFDVVVSNPPYLVPADLDRHPPLRFEPEQALVAGPTGTEIHIRVIREAVAHLAPGGWIVLEIGVGQGDAVTTLLTTAGFSNIRTRPDLAGIPRAMFASR
ncbi:MAG: peptide chain release factor N(5)-glutamine methyltransferase [Thermoleophilia bacterium]|nr:peptide chain release factor N(5)-glutamine methyltransferase [Thermoleophilia bacterium]